MRFGINCYTISHTALTNGILLWYYHLRLWFLLVVFFGGGIDGTFGEVYSGADWGHDPAL